MARFTLTLAEAFQLSGGTWETIDGRTVLTGGDIGLNHYEIFDEAHRATLNGLIFDHYMNEEIGTESLALFRLRLRSRMNEIMPYYNQLYKAELIDIDPLSTVNIDSTSHATATGETENNTERSSTVDSATETGSGARNVNSTTPQVMLSGNKDYASSASDANSQTHVEAETTENVDGTDTSNTVTETTATNNTTGYQGHSAELMARYRELVINVDTMVIGSLVDLFMLVWGTNDPYTEANRYWQPTYLY